MATHLIWLRWSLLYHKVSFQIKKQRDHTHFSLERVISLNQHMLVLTFRSGRVFTEETILKWWNKNLDKGEKNYMASTGPNSVSCTLFQKAVQCPVPHGVPVGMWLSVRLTFLATRGRATSAAFNKDTMSPTQHLQPGSQCSLQSMMSQRKTLREIHLHGGINSHQCALLGLFCTSIWCHWTCFFTVISRQWTTLMVFNKAGN